MYRFFQPPFGRLAQDAMVPVDKKLHVKDGKLVDIEGDENASFNQGRACPRVLALKQYTYHPDRITTPLKRVATVVKENLSRSPGRGI